MKDKGRKQQETWLQGFLQKNITVFCIIITVILVCIPAIFIVVEMGVFSKKPTVTTRIEAPKDAPVLRIVADEGFAPRIYKNEKGEYAGADVEVALEVANRLGMRPEIQFSDWISARNTLNAGKADIILGLEIFSNMKGVYKTIPISNDSLNVYGKKKVKDAASLAGKKVALMAKSVIMTTFELNCEYVEYDTNTEILQALANGEVDFAICHGSVARNIIKENNLKLKEGFRLMESYPAIGVRDDLPELRDSINHVLKEMADDGTIKKYENKWINASMNHNSFENVLKNNGRFYLVYLCIVLLIEFVMIVFVLQSRHYNESMEYNDKIREQYNLLKSMAKNYISMHLISLKDNRISEFSSTDALRKSITDDMGATQQMQRIMTNLVVPEMREKALKFVDLSTVAERIGENRTISREFIGKNIGWFRAQFDAVTYEEDNLSEVMFTILVIDHEKRREEYLLRLSNIDELTGIYNRRAYETDVEKLREDLRDDFIFVSLDLNGLKVVNDTKGHKAGDRMLQQAAECIDESFSPYGKVYRVGGDEFIALIYTAEKNMAAVEEGFHKKLEEHSQKEEIEVSVSCGYAARTAHQNADIDELEMIADKNMYQQKALYYKSTAHDRRKQ